MSVENPYFRTCWNVEGCTTQGIEDDECQCHKDAKEQERLRKVIRRHWNFALFVNLWLNREDIADADRVQAIKHHPFLKELVEGAASHSDDRVQDGDKGGGA